MQFQTKKERGKKTKYKQNKTKRELAQKIYTLTPSHTNPSPPIQTVQ